jgi:hypothetical protein
MSHFYPIHQAVDLSIRRELVSSRAYGTTHGNKLEIQQAAAFPKEITYQIECEISALGLNTPLQDIFGGR